jgi:hypothetical protein
MNPFRDRTIYFSDHLTTAVNSPVSATILYEAFISHFEAAMLYPSRRYRPTTKNTRSGKITDLAGPYPGMRISVQNFAYFSQKYCAGSKSLSFQIQIGHKNLKGTDQVYMRNLCTCCLESIIDDIMPFVITYMFSFRKNGRFPDRKMKVHIVEVTTKR